MPQNSILHDMSRVFCVLFVGIVAMVLQEADELYDLQQQEWSPVLQWFCRRYDVQIGATRDIAGPKISQETKSKLVRHLSSYNFWAIHGMHP